MILQFPGEQENMTRRIYDEAQRMLKSHPSRHWSGLTNLSGESDIHAIIHRSEIPYILAMI